ncbi:MAG TPA: hypothetical protein VMW57_01675 [Methyloceanibacter sp.]|nr:hypothetical protein [Methyloceanibacter sp.]
MKFHSGFAAGTALAFVVGLAVAASPAFAKCNPDNALFEDNFEFMDI